MKISCAFLVFHMCAKRSAHLIVLNLITLVVFGEAYKLWSFSFCRLLQPTANSSLLGPKSLLSTLVSNTFTLCSSLMWDQFSHPYKTTGKVTVLYILIFQFTKGTGKQETEQNDTKHSPNLIRSHFLLQCHFDLLLLFPSTCTFLPFKGFFRVSKLWFCPTFLWRDEHILSPLQFTSRPTSTQASEQIRGFLCGKHRSLSDVLHSISNIPYFLGRSW
jgi:hypothetical protein